MASRCTPRLLSASSSPKSVAEAEFPAKLRFLFEAWRYKVLYGGRGGAKSWGIARALLIQAAQQKLRVLCAREIQKSIADSVHKLLGEQIEALGLGHFYDVQQSVIRGANGSEFIFVGLHTNLASIKSMEGLDRVWLEEAQAISKESLAVLIPTVRKEGSELWFSFNPDDGEEPVYQDFVVHDPPPGSRVVEIGWADNPWLPDVLRQEKDALYARDPEAAAHVWGGKPRRNSVAQVLRGRYSVESFEPVTEHDDPKQIWHGPYYGLDFGFATTPLALVRCWVFERRLHIEHEVSGLEIDNDDMPARLAITPGVKEHVVRADASRPETISHLKRHGFPRVTACYKWKGSVEDGVEHLRSYEKIIIHPRCELAALQARLYSYKVDKLTGDVKPDLDDKHDDVWDAVRYALEPIIRRGKPKPKPDGKPPEPPRDYSREEQRASGWKIV